MRGRAGAGIRAMKDARGERLASAAAVFAHVLDRHSRDQGLHIIDKPLEKP